MKIYKDFSNYYWGELSGSEALELWDNANVEIFVVREDSEALVENKEEIYAAFDNGYKVCVEIGFGKK